MEQLVEGQDFYFNDEGYIVLTESFHLKKGNCCGNGCKHCPYDYIKVPEPKRTDLRNARVNKILRGKQL